VACAHVVGVEVLDHVEAGQPGFVERHVIGGADSLDDVPRRAQILQRLEPAIEDVLRRAIPFHVKAERLAASRIVIQIHRELVACGRSVEVLRQIGARAQQALLFAAPERYADRAPRLGAEGAKDPHRLDQRRGGISVVRSAGRGVPRVEVSANEHDLIAQRGVAPRNFADDVVAVAIVFEVARPELDPERDRMSTGREAREDVVLLAGYDDRGHGVGRCVAIAQDTDGAVTIRARLQRDRRAGACEQRHQICRRRRAARLRQRRIARRDWTIVEPGLRSILVDPLGLRKMREDDGPAELAGHRLDLRCGLVADVYRPPAHDAFR
jgi:hypothetical protein